MPRTYVPFCPTFFFIKLLVQIARHGADTQPFGSFCEVVVEGVMYVDINVEVVMFGDITSCLLRGISSLLTVFLRHQFVPVASKNPVWTWFNILLVLLIL